MMKNMKKPNLSRQKGPFRGALGMKKNSSLTKVLLAGLLLVAMHPALAGSSKDLIASWTELSETKTQEAGSRIFKQALLEVTPMIEEDPIKASRLFFKAAEFCRDMNDVRHAITLFELAIKANPDDPHFRRIYGDYLIGYRGLEEQAWGQLHTAKKLSKTYPDKVGYNFGPTLDRSIHIFRRDTNDGVHTFERNRSDGTLLFENDSLTITGGLDTLYKKTAKDALDLSTDYFRAVGFYNVNDYLDFYDKTGKRWSLEKENPEVGDTPETTAEKLKNNAEDLKTAAKLIVRQNKSSETLASFLFRTANANLPAVRLSYFNISMFEGGLDVEAINRPSYRVDDSIALELEKTIVIENDLFLEGDLGLVYKNTQGRYETNVEEYDTLDLFSALNLRKEWGTSHGIIRLNVGGAYSRDLFDFEAYPKHEQSVSLRNSSFFEDPVKNDARQRFRGRRSSHQEMGLRRAEIRSENGTKEENWSFFVSSEELGLADGVWDLYTTYSYRERNLSAGDGEGSYSIHQFSVEPMWVPVYKLYDNDFTSGWEFVTVGFPVSVNSDEGPYDRVRGGVTLKGQRVFPNRLTLGISVGVEYAYYTQLNERDLGGFIRLSIF